MKRMKTTTQPKEEPNVLVMPTTLELMAETRKTFHRGSQIIGRDKRRKSKEVRGQKYKGRDDG
jgi:hypothetical protein